MEGKLVRTTTPRRDFGTAAGPGYLSANGPALIWFSAGMEVSAGRDNADKRGHGGEICRVFVNKLSERVPSQFGQRFVLLTDTPDVIFTAARRETGLLRRGNQYLAF